MIGAALITGAAKRLGKEMALHLAARGVTIALHYNTSSDAAQETAEEIRRRGGRCSLFCGDLTQPDGPATLIQQVRALHPHLNLLINSASIFERSTLTMTSPDLLERHMAIHVRAPFLLTQAFQNGLESGQIINILDTRIAGRSPIHAAYTLSKKALAELTLMSAKEFGPRIRVNGLAPGFMLPAEGADPAETERLSRNNPLGRRCEIAEFLSALNSLVDNAYLTGQIIYLDGGHWL